MDRKIVYAGQVPLETDLLGSNLYAMIGLGHLAQALIGTGTVASGLACTPTTPASMSVKIGAGSLYSPQNVDNSAYSSITANTTDQIVKQAILLASENKTLALTAPTTPGNSVIYLIQAAYSDLDTDDTTLPYYNAANPSVPYSGPGGSGAAQSTRRKGAVNITAKVGIASTSPVAPAPDSGFVGLYTITVAYGATTITSGNIAVASGAPFLTSGPYLTPPAAAAIYAPLTGATFTGNVTVQGSGSATLGTSGDITAARVGGADGLLFFGTSGTR
ncbi:MAG TPA: hypothetical protein VF503_12100, partial [Sphingobium sp.]|uniref:hypothetical protein n=1 Tax=Sphingobium sp. TaxID=1912891 RepID=UPI002ED619BB